MQIFIWLTPARQKGGGPIDPPPLEQNFVTFLLANSIACRFLRKKIEKNMYGGPPKRRTWPKCQKKYTENIDLPVLQHFTSLVDKIDLRVDSGSQDLYLAPCKKSKSSEIYFTLYYNRHLKLAYFCRFRGRDELSRKFVLMTIFNHTGVNFKKLLHKGYIS